MIKHCIIIALLLFSCISVHADDTTLHFSIVVIFVEPAGETFTFDEMHAALDHVYDAAAFWQDLSPIAVTFTLSSTQLITAPNDIANTRSLNTVQPKPLVMPIYIVDAPFLDTYYIGFATMFNIWITATGNSAEYTHEFGHFMFNLPHEFQQLPDIMSVDPFPAYQRYMIGCGTLAQLGKPCSKVHLPIIR